MTEALAAKILDGAAAYAIEQDGVRSCPLPAGQFAFTWNRTCYAESANKFKKSDGTIAIIPLRRLVRGDSFKVDEKGPQ